MEALDLTELPLIPDKESFKVFDWVFTIKLFDDSPYRHTPSGELMGQLVNVSGLLDEEQIEFGIVDVIDYGANTTINPGPAYRLLKVRQI